MGKSMIAKVYDNLFSPAFVATTDEMVFNLPVSCTNEANGKRYPDGGGGTHRLFGENLFERSSVNTVTNWSPKASVFFNMLRHIEEVTETTYYLSRIDLNLQHSFCDGSAHIDGDYSNSTIMYFSNCQWEKEWGGQFQILDGQHGNVIEEYEYVPGRVIIFPSNYWHRGLGPRHPYVYRYSIVWRVTAVDSIDL